MHPRHFSSARLVTAALVLSGAMPALGDPAPYDVRAITATEARELGYRDWIPADDTQVALYAKSERVDRADLDLSDPEHMAILVGRIRAAATRACKAIGDGHALAQPKVSVCAREATERALVNLRRQVDRENAGQLASAD
jgi:UrcA family protein